MQLGAKRRSRTCLSKKRRLAISRNSGGNLDVYVVNADGSGAQRLTRDASHEWAADWRMSP